MPELVTGLEILEDRIKIIQILKEKEDFRVKLAKEIPLKPLTIENGRLLSSASFSKSVKEAFLNIPHKGKVFVSLPEELIIARNFRLPKMKTKEVKKAILNELSQYKVFQNVPPLIDFIVFKAEPFNNIYASACNKEEVLKYQKALKRAGISPYSFENPTVAALRFIKIISEDLIKGSIILINISYLSTRVSCIKNGEILSTNSIDIGSKDIEDSYQKTLWQGQVINSLVFFEKEHSIKEGFKRIIIIGNSANLKEIENLISERSNISTLIVDRDNFFKKKGEKDFKNYNFIDDPVISSGLALTEFKKDEIIKLNLISEFKILRMEMSFQIISILILFLIANAVLYFSYSYLLNENLRLIKSIKGVESEIKNLEPLKGGIDKLKQELGFKKEELQTINNALQIKKNALSTSLLNIIEKTIPDTITIFSFKSQVIGEIEIEGVSSNYQSIYNFVSSISKEEKVKKVTIDNVDFVSENLLSFTIKIVMKQGE